MNRYFITEEGRRDFPKRAFARIDQIEPINPESAEEITFSFDAIDADWEGLGRGNLLSPDDAADSRRRKASFWQSRFNHRSPDEGADDPFEDAPLYQIEMTLPRDHDWAVALANDSSDWVEIELDHTSEIEVDVFGGLFQAPVTARMAHPPRPAGNNLGLSLAFDMDLWPDASSQELQSALVQRHTIEQLVVFDVGQGSASALVCDGGYPIYYYDVGCGVYRNTKTNPPNIRFCDCDRPPVILSHWDSDHWAGAAKATALQTLTWIAPRQTIGPKHATFANAILKAGGSILIVPTSMSSIPWGSGQSLELRRCTGKPSDRNGTGLALIVEDPGSQRGWLMTGDAAYDLIPGPLPADLAAIVVPHHGADMGASSVPPTHSRHAYSRLIYSFGPGNAHGRSSVRHPTSAAMAAHVSASWPHAGWAPPPPGMGRAAQPVLATASNMSTHQDGAAAGWTSPPAAPAHIASCPNAMPITQT